MTTTTATAMVRCQFCDTWNRVDATRLPDRPKCGKCGRFLLLDRPYPLFSDSFQRTITDSDIPVLVDFYADWCAPCRMMAPAVDEIARLNSGKALVAKLDTDRAQEISESLGIRGIPTTIVFRKGKEIGRRTGALPLAELQALLNQALEA